MLALQVAADGFDILRVDGCHHHRPVVALACSWIGGQIFVDWVRCQHGIVVAESECVMARPAVAAWIVDHRCAQWVEFDIAVALQEIVAIFDQTGFVAAFPQCPAAVVGVVEVADIASAQRLQSARDRAGSLRCEQQVDVIGHQHVSMYRAALAQCHFAQSGAIAEVVRVREETRLAVVAALHDVLGDAGKVGAERTWHGAPWREYVPPG